MCIVKFFIHVGKSYWASCVKQGRGFLQWIGDAGWTAAGEEQGEYYTHCPQGDFRPTDYQKINLLDLRLWSQNKIILQNGFKWKKGMFFTYYVFFCDEKLFLDFSTNKQAKSKKQAIKPEEPQE